MKTVDPRLPILMISIAVLTGPVQAQKMPAYAAESLTASAEAGETGENRNLFKDAGEKQEGTDFKPAPDKIETNFGTLEFEYGAYPTEETAQKI